MRFIALCTIVLSSLLLTNVTYAGWAIGLGQANFNSDHTQQEGIDDNATIINFAYVRGYAQTAYSLGINVYLLDDNDGFSQNTTGGVRSSSASGVSLFGDYGFKLNISPNTNFILKAGYETNLEASRSIANCTNCFEEDIDLDAGLYGQIGLRFILKNDHSIWLRYNAYTDSDNGVENAFNLDWAF